MTPYCMLLANAYMFALSLPLHFAAPVHSAVFFQHSMLFFFHNYELPTILQHQVDPDDDLLADPIAALTDEVRLPGQAENLPVPADQQQQVPPGIQNDLHQNNQQGQNSHRQEQGGPQGQDQSTLGQEIEQRQFATEGAFPVSKM